MTESLLKNPRLIGLTGNIATGKSAVTGILRRLGAHVIDADQVARDVVEPGQPALAQIAAAFGPNVLDAAGALDRKAIGRIVFNNPAQMQKLESITHPVIREAMLSRISSAPADKITVIEVIKLFERGYDARCGQVWVTNCPQAMQIARLMSARGLSETDARARVSAQAPQAEKVARADVVIDTSGTFEDTEAQVLRAWRAVSRLS